MTTMPHTGIGRSPARFRVGARLIKPSSATSSGASADSQGRVLAAVSASGASLKFGAVGVGMLAGSIGAKPIRLVLAGTQSRLGSRAFVLVVLGALSLTLATLLFLNTSLAQDSFRLTAIRQNAKELQLQEQVLVGQLAAAESPVGLGQRAIEFGMVAPSGPARYLNLGTGKLIGSQNPGVAPPVAKVKGPKTPAADAVAAPTSITSGGGSVMTTDAGEVAVDPATGLPLIAVTTGPAAATAPSGQPGAYPPLNTARVPLAQTLPGGELPLGLVSGGSQ